MWKVEEDFPRGKVQIKKDVQRSYESKESKFQKVSKESICEIKKPQKRKSLQVSPVQPMKRQRIDGGQKGFKGPLQEDICPDLCVLGCIRQVFEHTISMSLPGNVVGTLPITELSKCYTQQLNKLIETQELDHDLEEIKSLNALFKPGLLLTVRIEKITALNDKKKIILSNNPFKINSSIPLKGISDGMLLFGSVSSVEDHGYSVELGINGVQGFLPSKNAETYVKSVNGGSLLCLGQPLWCVVQLKDKGKLTDGEKRVLPVTIEPSVVQSSGQSDATNLNSLLPGMNLKGVVQSVMDCGLVVNVSSLKGHVHFSQLPKPPNKFTIGQQVNLKLLYIDVNTKILQLTALPKIVHFDGSPLQLFSDLKVGTICDAKVAWTQNKIGVFFHLSDDIKGLANMTHLSDQPNEIDLQKFVPNSLYKCRILGFNYMGGLAHVSLKKSVLAKKFITINDLSIGDVREVEVKEVTEKGILVKLAKCIFSFVSCVHLADVPIKHPEKKFTVGMKLKCRILRIDLDTEKVFLSHKKSLVKMKKPVTDYKQLKLNMEVEGYISTVKDKVVVVNFFNNVKGYVTVNDMSKEKGVNPHSLFYVGQVIRCRVIFSNAQEKKLKLSFNLGEEEFVTAVEKSIEPLDASIRLISEAHIISVDSIGFTIMLGNKKRAFLPFYHLSDFHEVQELRKLALKSGHRLDGLTFFKQKDKLIMTMKESFLSLVKTCSKIEKFEDLKSGMLLPAVIKNHQDYGMFLEIVNGYTGLCPTKTLSYLQPSNLQDLFKPGQSVITRLTKIDTEKQRFLGSIHINECSEGRDSSLELLKSYLLSRAKVHTQLFAGQDEVAAYKNLKVGSIVQLNVNTVLKKGILCDTAAGAKGLVTKDHFGDVVPKVGGSYQGVILFIDLLTPCIELTLDSKIVHSVKSFKETPRTKLLKNQVLKANVLLVKPEFMLMGLKGHGSGKFVYVPVKQHLNDVNVQTYSIGSFTDIVIKDCVEEFQLGIFKVHDLETTKLCIKNKKSAHSSNLNSLMGCVVEAKVRSIHALQLNIVVKEFHGRVHITEICDSVQDGDNPLKKFHPEETVKVKIIGFRDLETFKYLPITKPTTKGVLLECSMKKSQMQVDSNNINTVNKLTGGDKVFVYINKILYGKVWVQISISQQGYIDFFHLSKDIDVLNNVTRHFLPGQGYQATVLRIENDDKAVLSLIGIELKPAENEEVTALITNLQGGKCINVKLSCGRLGVIKQKPSVQHYVGQYIQCKLETLNTESGKCVLSVLSESDLPTTTKKKRKRKDSVETKPTGPKKLKKKTKVVKPAGHQDSFQDDRDISKPKETNVPRLTIDGFSWKGESLPCQKIQQEDIDSDDEKDKTKTESADIKKKRKHAEELQIQEHELHQMKEITNVQSSADFEKLVIQSPNSSVIWIAFMTYHIELGEIEKARVIAERALNTILFREEQEKMNVWMAYLNMETIYGDSSDVKKLLDRATSCNNPLDMYLKMTDIYLANEKITEAEELFRVMTHKYKHEKLIWKSYGQFLFKTGQLDTARSVLQRAILVLDKRDHVEVITRFATLEFSHGDIERGCTIFENLLASYPGRTDLWSVYVDMLVKAGDITGARHLLERAVKQKFNVKKLSFLLQKFRKFEENHGTEEQVEKVKELASTVLN